MRSYDFPGTKARFRLEMPRSRSTQISLPRIQKKRALFTTAKRRLRDLNYKYARLYPAKLKILADNKFFFTSAQEVLDWLEARPHVHQRSPRRQNN